MAVDDNTNYTLTGAQVKDLVARIKAGGGGGMTVYVDAPFDDASSITNVFSDSALTTAADWNDMADAILAGTTVTAIYDNGSNKHQYVELTSVNLNDNVAAGKRFGGVITEDSGTSQPIIIFLYYNDGSLSPRWYAESIPVPTKTSNITNDGADGTSTYVEADELATVATSGSYNDLSNKPTIPAAQVNSDWNSTSGVSQILNRPGIKNATAATHTDYNNNQDYLPNMRFLSFWNGAYNSSGNSNLAHLASNAVKTANITDSAVTTAKINNSAVTTDKINNSAVTKAKMAHIPSPDPSNVITNWGSISASGNNEKTMSADGFVVGKGCTFAGDQSAIVKLNGQEVGGVSYTTFSGYMQVPYCIPVKSGDKVQFYLNKSGPQHQGCKLIGWKM